mmetsp:Transcript_40013/g.101638  ORF Transcript_40013/g.101638 Transcript_40013/m.101638 type:complete len:214 (-) Transcript_40013:240-881(-)
MAPDAWSRSFWSTNGSGLGFAVPHLRHSRLRANCRSPQPGQYQSPAIGGWTPCIIPPVAAAWAAAIIIAAGRGTGGFNLPCLARAMRDMSTALGSRALVIEPRAMICLCKSGSSSRNFCTTFGSNLCLRMKSSMSSLPFAPPPLACLTPVFEYCHRPPFWSSGGNMPKFSTPGTNGGGSSSTATRGSGPNKSRASSTKSSGIISTMAPDRSHG